MKFALIFLTFCLQAQTIEFSLQSYSRIPGLQEVQVKVESPKQIINYSAMNVIKEALHQNLRLFYPVNLTAYVENLNKRSSWRYVALGCEIAGAEATALFISRLVIVKERVITLVPIVASSCTLFRSIKDASYERVEIPIDVMPSLLSIPANGTVVYAAFAAY